MSQIICQNVSLSYEGKTAVKDLNFSVNEGNYLCIVGENGAGKTTLIKALLHLKSPSSGTILTGDGLNLHEIGYLPQQTVFQKSFPASVNEIVLSGRLNTSRFKPFFTAFDKRCAAEQMERLSIIELKNKCYRELSGGQQQRVLLARALCAAKKLILLDEPVAGLDPIASRSMYESVYKINKNGMTVIMVSHDIEGVLAHASHVLHIANHTQFFFGTTDAYKSSNASRKFLGTITGHQMQGEHLYEYNSNTETQETK